MAFNLFKKDEKKKSKPRAKAPVVDAVEQVNESPSVQIAVGTSVLKYFHVSEKSARAQANNAYVFAVADSATKTDVKHAVQRAFKVGVTAVRLIRLPAKKRRIGRWQGTKSGVKKAIVTLKEGQSIAQAQP